MLVDDLYDFIPERSMTRGFHHYFLQLSERNQSVVGFELLALRTWAVSHVL